jgi:amino acid permease
MAKVFSIIMVTFCFGALVSFFITINKFALSLMADFNIITAAQQTSFQTMGSGDYHFTCLIIGATAVLVYPIACFRSLSAFRYLTIFGFCVVTYITLLTAVETPTFHNYYSNLYDTPISWAKFSIETIPCWSICTYCYTCHSNLFPVRSELQRAETSRMMKISNRVASILTVMYSILGVTGFLSTIGDTPQIFITRPAPPGFNDIMMIIGKIALLVNLLFSIPINNVPLRIQVLLVLKKDLDCPPFFRYCLTLVLIAATAGTAMLIPNIVTAISIIGGICCTTLCTTFPTLVYLKYTKMRDSHWKRPILYAIGTITTLAGFSSAGITVYQMFVPSSIPSS